MPPHARGQLEYGRGLHAGNRHRIRGAGLRQGRGAGSGARHHRAVADLVHRAYANPAGPGGLAGSGLGILRRHAAGGLGRGGELFLERRAAARRKLARRAHAPRLQGPVFSAGALDRARHHPDRDRRPGAGRRAEHLQFAAARPRRDRRGLYRDGGPARDRRVARAPCPHPRGRDLDRRHAGRHRAGRRAHSRRVALRLHPDGGARARLQARRGGALLVPARAARDRARRLQGAMGAAQGPPRRPRMVDPGGRPGGRLDLGLRGDLDPDAGAGALLGLAVRHLPRRARRHPAGGTGGGLAGSACPYSAGGLRCLSLTRGDREAVGWGSRHKLALAGADPLPLRAISRNAAACRKTTVLPQGAENEPTASS